VYYDEVMHWRISISRAGVLEIRNDAGPLLQLRIIEENGTIRTDTPNTRIIQKEADASVEIYCKGPLTAKTDDSATVTVAKDLTATVKGDAQLTAGGALNLKGQTIDIEATGVCTIKGAMVNIN
jgi:hypothetical protein